MESERYPVDGETYASACFAGALGAIPSAVMSGIAAFESVTAFNGGEHLATAIGCLTALGAGWLVFLKVKSAIINHFSKR